MPKSTKISEIDLRPYQTHFLFESDSSLTSDKLDKLFKELPAIIDDALSEDDEPSQIIQKSIPRSVNGERLAWLAYSRKIAVRWASGPDAPKDLEHHLVVMMARSTFLSVVASDKSLGFRLGRSDVGKEWSKLKRVPFRRLEKALVLGTTRTLWLSGIHRSVATKPDSKVLIGPDIEASLDARLEIKAISTHQLGARVLLPFRPRSLGSRRGWRRFGWDQVLIGKSFLQIASNCSA
jgi:hypothetical protein